ncbi:hypothetical protein [Pandoraea sp.]|uniref:hypothetical protein n=1 Tax=Pandoraea sp. TaxID=1883445 RepID=UPI0035B375A2
MSKLSAALPSLPAGGVKKIAQRNCDDLAALRDSMLRLTMNSHDRRGDLIRSELNALIALNDMAREAERELTNGGADVPLRLAVRDGNWVLKPAASTSRFARNKTRAANDSARLALLLGYPADRPVTLTMIRSRGFGAHEYTSVLNDARSSGREAARSWLAGRALDIDTWKAAGNAVHDDLTPAATSPAPAGTRASSLDDSLLDEDRASTVDNGHLSLDSSRSTVARQAGAVLTSRAAHPSPIDSASGAAPGSPEMDAAGYARIARSRSSDVPHFECPDGSEYALVTRTSTPLEAPEDASPLSRRERFAEAFCKANPGRQHGLRELFARSMVSGPQSSDAGLRESRNVYSRRTRASELPPPPPSSPPPSSLDAIPE